MSAVSIKFNIMPKFKLWSQLKQKRSKIVGAWLDQRIPIADRITLSHQKIFILPTRQGLNFVLVMIALFIGGINYQNSLVLGMTFLLGSLFMVSILHTFRNLSGVCFQSGHTEASFVGDFATFHITLSREGERIYEAIQLDWGGCVPQIIDLIEDTEHTARMLLPVKSRGIYKPGRIYVETRYPLGLFKAWSWVDLGASCLVYPQPKKSTFPSNNHMNSELGRIPVKEGNDDFDGLRKYKLGDPLRQIDWKAYARGNGLQTKTFVGYADETIWLDLDSVLGSGVEEGLSRLCYWVLKFSEKNQNFGLKLADLEIEPGVGHAHKIKCLETLALFGLQSD